STTSSGSFVSAVSTRRRRSTTTSSSPTSASTCRGCREATDSDRGSGAAPRGPRAPSRGRCRRAYLIEDWGELSAPPNSPHREVTLAGATGGFAFLEGAEHPRHLLVLFHQAREEVVRAHVVKLARRGVRVGA